VKVGIVGAGFAASFHLRSYPQEIQDFIEAIALDRAPLSGLELAKQVVEVIYAGYVSMEERRKVALSVTA